jgi:hypothetical protein
MRHRPVSVKVALVSVEWTWKPSREGMSASNVEPEGKCLEDSSQGVASGAGGD